MPRPRPSKSDAPPSDFDYSSPEALAALRDVTALILEIRDEYAGSTARKVNLYERSLGLAVIPLLLRRAALRACQARRRHGGSA
ncbi:MAG: hypothetical protein R2826_00895 [Thermoleophilia bacterium]